MAALEGGGFVITWIDAVGEVRAQIFDETGQPVGNSLFVTSYIFDPGEKFAPSVTGLSGGPFDGGFVITWDEQGDIKARIYTAGGEAFGGPYAGNPFLVNTTTSGDQINAGVTGLANGEFVVVWNNGSQVRGQIFDAFGFPVGDEFSISAMLDLFSSASVSTFSDGSFVVTYPIGDEICGQIFDATGQAVGEEFLVASTTGDYQSASSVTVLEGGTFVVAWGGNDLSGVNQLDYEIRGQMFGAATITDPDNTSIESATITLTGFVLGEDVLSFTDQNGIAGSYTYDEQTSTLTLILTGSASLADYGSALRSVTYQNTSDDPATVPRQISFTVNDGVYDSNTVTRQINVIPVNDAPMGSPAADLSNGNEDEPYTVTVGQLLNGFTDLEHDTLSVSNLIASNGSIAFDGDQTYTITPEENFNGTMTLTYNVSDGNGGVLTGQTQSYTVNPVSDAPVLVTTALIGGENQIVAGPLVAIDGDGDALTFSLTGNGPDDAQFGIDPASGFLLPLALDYENPTDANADGVYEVEVTVGDGTGESDTGTVVITVEDVNETPSAGSDRHVSFAEVINEATILTTVPATDPDVLADSDAVGTNDAFNDLTYTITSGDPAGLFAIDGNGNLSLAAGRTLDYETVQQHVLQVTVTDGGGLSDTAQVTIDVTDTNEAPSAGPDINASFAETINQTTILASVLAADPDVLADSDADGTNDAFNDLTYFITGGDPAGLFEIDGNGGISLTAGHSLDYETAQQHVLQVTVADGGGAFDIVNVTIAVTDVNEAPSSVPIIVTSIVETVDESTILASVFAADPDVLADSDSDGTNDTFNDLTYAITSGDPDGLFEIDGNGNISLAPGKALDFETVQQHVLQVRVADGDGLFDLTQVTINVIDGNDAPILPATAFTVDEMQTAVGLVAATDPNCDSLLFSLTATGPDNSLFTITPGGFLSFGVVPDYEHGPVGSIADHIYEVEVQINDGNPAGITRGTIQVAVDDIIADGQFNLANLDSGEGFRINGISFGDESGFAVSDAGDVNGDGYQDLIIGAPGASQSYVVFGGQDVAPSGILELSSLNGTNGFIIETSPVLRSGSSVSSAGDINHDGYDDLIIGDGDAFGSDGVANSRVVFGGPDVAPSGTLFASDLDLDGTNGFLLQGPDFEDLTPVPVSVSAGDINGDGIDDVIVGVPTAPNASGDPVGQTFVVFGGQNFAATIDLATLDGTNGFRIDGIGQGVGFFDNDLSGFSVSGDGDVTGDGTNDLLIGAPGAEPDFGTVGETYLVFGGQNFGSSFSLTSLNGSNGYRFVYDNTNIETGFSVSIAGDINGDGADDLIIGSPEAGDSYVVYGGLEHFQALDQAGTFPSIPDGTIDLGELDASNAEHGFKNRQW